MPEIKPHLSSHYIAKLKLKTVYVSLLNVLERRVEDLQEIVIRIH
jgi:hypothetical protein